MSKLLEVVIEVRDGVATVTQCPDNVMVEIIDWDDEESKPKKKQ